MKRFGALVLCLSFAAILCCGMAGASTRASDYLSSYNAVLSTGNTRGELQLDWNITAKKSITSIGISEIVVYTANGDYVKTITGTEANGLVFSSGSSHYETYYFSATAGEKYYAEITFFAKDSSGEDSKPFTTRKVVAAS